jgi:hypothetical protein
MFSRSCWARGGLLKIISTLFLVAITPSGPRHAFSNILLVIVCFVCLFILTAREPRRGAIKVLPMRARRVSRAVRTFWHTLDFLQSISNGIKPGAIKTFVNLTAVYNCDLFLWHSKQISQPLAYFDGKLSRKNVCAAQGCRA